MDELTLQIFHDSFDRCTRHEDFLDAFYLRLLTSSEEEVSFLKPLSAVEQTLLVKSSIYIVLTASSNDPDTLVSVERLREAHSMIPGAFWDLWLGTLLGTVAEFDSRYGEEVEAAWRLVMEPGLARLRDDPWLDPAAAWGAAAPARWSRAARARSSSGTATPPTNPGAPSFTTARISTVRSAAWSIAPAASAARVVSLLP